MLQVEDGILLVLVLIVGRRGIYHGAAHLLGTLGPEEHILDLSVRHVLGRIEVLVVRGNLDSALPAAGAEEEAGAGIVHHAAVDDEVIVVEALVHGNGSGAPPVSVSTLAEHGTALSAEAEGHYYRLGLGSIDAEARISLGVDHGILLSGSVERRRHEVFLDHCVVACGIEVLHDIVGPLGLVVVVEQQGIVVHSEP